MSKFLAAIAVLVILVAGLYYFMPEIFGGTAATPVATSTATTTSPRAYTSDEYGVSFTYPDTYTLAERDTNEVPPVHVVTLADTDALQSAPQNGEGPTSITLSIFDATSTSPAEWVRNSVSSNFQLSGDGVLASTTVDGLEAVRYTSDGLYATDNVVLVHESRIYMFSVGWLSRSDAIVQDFEELLTTVQFE